MNLRKENAQLIAKQHDFKYELIKGGDFWLTVYSKNQDLNLPVAIYLEGDGAISNGKYKISTNPTPASPLVLKLASLDPRKNVIYIARPCQYTDFSLNPQCANTNKYWSSQRFAPEIVDSIKEVIQKVAMGRQIHLIGFSGGGGLAVLLASEMNTVRDILTIAGNLDIEAFIKHTKSMPYENSLNPIDYAKKINWIPQLHLTGGKDKNVPPFIAENYVKASNSTCVKMKILPTNSHSKGWLEKWEYLLSIPIICSTSY